MATRRLSRDTSCGGTSPTLPLPLARALTLTLTLTLTRYVSEPLVVRLGVLRLQQLRSARTRGSPELNPHTDPIPMPHPHPNPNAKTLTLSLSLTRTLTLTPYPYP